MVKVYTLWVHGPLELGMVVVAAEIMRPRPAAE